jgi:peptidoglycan/LPS O-acetylase OafA/YrhL
MLMYVHERDFVSIRSAALSRFFRLRFFRVYPLSAVVLLLIAAFVAFDPGFIAWQREVRNPQDFSAIAFLQTLCLATRWFVPSQGEWNEPVWSLSVEILGYAAFPVMAWLVGRQQSVWSSIAVAFCSLAALSVALAVTHAANVNATGRFSVLRMTGCLVAGIALCRTWRLIAPRDRRWPTWLAALCCVCLILSCLTSWADLLTNFALGGIIFALAFQQGPIDRILGSKPVAFLGKISFPFYLVHVVPLLWLRYHFSLHPGPPLLVGIYMGGYVILALLMATILHYAVEVPAHAFGRLRARRIADDLHVPGELVRPPTERRVGAGQIEYR